MSKNKNLEETAVFKYKKCIERDINSIAEESLWLSNVSSFNDKFEYKSYIDLDKSLKLYLNDKYTGIRQKFINETREKLYKKMSDTYDIEIDDDNILKDGLIDFVDKFGRKYSDVSVIGCLSYLYDSEPMWSFYSDYNTGFIKVYSMEALRKKVDYLFDVIYDASNHDMTDMYFDGIDDMIEYNAKYKGKISSDDFKRLIKGYTEDRLLKLILNKLGTKHTDWKYEEELRILKVIGKKTLGEKIYVKPQAVILGSDIFQYHEKKIVSICNDKEIPVYQMRMTNNSVRKMKIFVYETSDEIIKFKL